MRLDAIIRIADKAYPDGLVGQAYKQIKAKKPVSVGDTLAEFIAREITETYEPTAGTKVQLDEAIRVMETAVREVEAVRSALAIERELKPVKPKKRRAR